MFTVMQHDDCCDFPPEWTGPSDSTQFDVSLISAAPIGLAGNFRPALSQLGAVKDLWSRERFRVVLERGCS